MKMKKNSENIIFCFRVFRVFKKTYKIPNYFITTYDNS